MGSRIVGADETTPSRTMARLRPTLARVMSPNCFVPRASSVKSTAIPP
jgi:hypothetical protein